jgi:hypothetical protein
MKDVITSTGDDAEIARRAKVYLAHIEGLQDPKAGIEKLSALIAETGDGDVLADANNFLGQHYAATNQPIEAALAFLRVHVFYATRQIPTAQARLGAAKALMAIENPMDARMVLRELVLKQSKTGEAQEGKKLLRQVEDILKLDKDSRTEMPGAAAAAPSSEAKPAETKPAATK